MTLHQFLFDRLWDRGVRHIFGIPGDFALNLYEAFERDGRFTLVRLSHEPAVGFAADGAARMTVGLGVCCVTYGAGGLNMVNPGGMRLCRGITARRAVRRAGRVRRSARASTCTTR